VQEKTSVALHPTYKPNLTGIHRVSEGRQPDEGRGRWTTRALVQTDQGPSALRQIMYNQHEGGINERTGGGPSLSGAAPLPSGGASGAPQSNELRLT